MLSSKKVTSEDFSLLRGEGPAPHSSSKEQNIWVSSLREREEVGRVRG
jgi:hypothetical protein